MGNFWIKGWIVAVGLGISVSAPSANQKQIFKNGKDYLKVETLSDTLFHFEFGTGAAPADNSPIPASPQVFKTNYTGAKKNDASAIFSVDEKTLCITLRNSEADAVLGQFCPDARTEFTQMAIDRGPMTDVYGLGEKFRTPGQPDGNWFGDIRKPAIEAGNMMTAFDENFTADMEIPIMYALGPGHLNYALFIDTVRPQTWDFQNSPWTMKTAPGVLRFYLITGQSMPELRRQFMELVGRPPIPPKKAFGLWVSQYGYQNWADMEMRLAILRLKKFPVDGFVLDLNWFGGVVANSPLTSMGKLTFDPKNFPQAARHLSDYKNRDGIGIFLIEESYVGRGLSEFDKMAKNNFLVQSAITHQPAIMSDWTGQVGMIDWTNPEGAKIWHKYKRQPLIDMGVFGHWTDLGEPLEPQGGGIYHGVDGVTGNGSMDVHNLYNFKWHESIAKGYEEEGVLQRPFMLSRSGTTGIQRFGGAFWSGDISGKLSSLAAHLNTQMNMSLSGFDYFGSDIGGFDRHKLDAEPHMAYTRWFAHGTAFDVPVRPHTAKFDESFKTSPAEMGWTDSNLSNLRQRYELIPYYYSLAHEAWVSGEAVFPPLVYYFQDDPKVRKLGHEKMIGPFMLVATGASSLWSTDVYLPEGEWFDYLDSTFYEAGQDGLTIPQVPYMRNNLFKLPTYVRGGAIIPKAFVDSDSYNALGKRSDNSQFTELRLDIYGSSHASQFRVYEDDGETIKYKHGNSVSTLVSQKIENGIMKVSVPAIEGPSGITVSHRNNFIRIFLPPEMLPHTALCNGQALKEYSEAKLTKQPEGWAPLNKNSYLIKTGDFPVTVSKTVELH